MASTTLMLQLVCLYACTGATVEEPGSAALHCGAPFPGHRGHFPLCAAHEGSGHAGSQRSHQVTSDPNPSNHNRAPNLHLPNCHAPNHEAPTRLLPCVPAQGAIIEAHLTKLVVEDRHKLKEMITVQHMSSITSCTVSQTRLFQTLSYLKTTYQQLHAMQCM